MGNGPRKEALAHLTDADFVTLLKPRYFGNLATMSSSGLVKCSLVIQELRIFTGKRTRAALWCMLAVIIIYTTVCFFFSIFICTPISAFWEQDIYALPADSPVRCIDYNALYCQSAHRPCHEVSFHVICRSTMLCSVGIQNALSRDRPLTHHEPYL